MENTAADAFWNSFLSITAFASSTTSRKALEADHILGSAQTVPVSEASPTSDCLEHLEGTGVSGEGAEQGLRLSVEAGSGGSVPASGGDTDIVATDSIVSSPRRRAEERTEDRPTSGPLAAVLPDLSRGEGQMGQHACVAFTAPPYVTDAGALVEAWDEARAAHHQLQQQRQQRQHQEVQQVQVVEEVNCAPRAHRHTRTRSFVSTTTTTTTILTAHDLADPLAKAQALLMVDGAGVLVSGTESGRRSNARGGSPLPGEYGAGSRSTSPCRQANTSQALVSSTHPQQGQLSQTKNQQAQHVVGGRRERNDELALVWDGMGPPPTVALATVTHTSGAEVVLARDLEIGDRVILKGLDGSEEVRLWLSDRSSATLHAATLVAKAGKGQVSLTLEGGNALVYRVERTMRPRPGAGSTSTALCVANRETTLILALPRVEERETQLATILVGLAAIHRDVTGLTLILVALVLMGEAYRRRVTQLQLENGDANHGYPLLQNGGRGDQLWPGQGHNPHHPHHRRRSSNFENALWDLELITERCTLGGAQREAMQERLFEAHGAQQPHGPTSGHMGHHTANNLQQHTTVTTTTTTTTTTSSSSSSDAYVSLQQPVSSERGPNHARHVSVTTSSMQEVKEVMMYQQSSVSGAGELRGQHHSGTTTHTRRSSMQCSTSTSTSSDQREVGVGPHYSSGGGRMVVTEVEDDEDVHKAEMEVDMEEERLRREMAAYQREALVEAREAEERRAAEERRMEALMAQMPERYLSVSQGVVEEARRRYRATLDWRAEQRIDEFLTTPHENFDLIKANFPQYMAGRDKRGIPVYYESTAQIDVKRLSAAGVGVNQLLWHQVFICEFIYARLITAVEDKMVTVIDVSGLYWTGLPAFLGNPLDFVLKALMVAQRHYPERNEVLLVINAPSWFSYIWNLVKHVFEDWATRRLRIVTEANSLAALRDYIDEDQIPVEYGGQLRFGNDKRHSVRFTSPFEVALRQHVEQVLEQNSHRRPLPVPELLTV